MEEPDNEIMIDDCIKRKFKMSEWEISFILSLKNNKNKIYTNKQIEKLDSIWERITS